MGIGRPVMYAFVESERFAPIRRLFGFFKEMMGEKYPVRTFVMDKLAAQMRAARVVFGSDIYVFLVIDTLCEQPTHIPSHGLPGKRRKVGFSPIVLHTHRFRQDLPLLRQTDPRFVSYLTACWLYLTRKLAVHAQSGTVHFGNVTDNQNSCGSAITLGMTVPCHHCTDMLRFMDSPVTVVKGAAIGEGIRSSVAAGSG
ncbi:hypothetical protein CSKR_102101 [Clonorchis sinensis]|uniref:Uncharacterized protein n=1 Tax=Clonorchis sinensis TaxID=79923 RepID=A0A3R7C4T9_CLOSI|nr:hypothetical protein CSKR_102101 [Clonorchis sinensis]